MSLVVILPADILLLLLSPENIVEIQRVSQDKVRHFVLTNSLYDQAEHDSWLVEDRTVWTLVSYSYCNHFSNSLHLDHN